MASPHQVWIIIACLIVSARISGQELNLKEQNQILLTDSTKSYELLSSLHKNGFWYSGIDSVNENGAFVHIGAQIMDNLEKIYIQEEDRPSFSEVPIRSSEDFITIQNRLIENYSSSGYPFAKFVIDSVRQDFSALYAHIVIGPFVELDSLIFGDNPPLSHSFLFKLLRSKVGEPFSEQKVIEFENKVTQLESFTMKTASQVMFEGNKAQMFVDIEQTQFSTFEGVLGIQQSQNTSGGNLVGYLNLELVNLLHSAKTLGVHWNRFGQQSQNMMLNYGHPFVLGSSLSIEIDFNLFKQDSTYLNQVWKVNGSVPIGKQTNFGFGYSGKVGSLVTPNIRDIANGFADVKTDNYSLSIQRGRYQSPFPFGTYWKYRIGVSVGEKQIFRNSLLDSRTYDTLKLNSIVWQGDFGIKYLIDLGKRRAFYHRVEGKSFINDQILLNEVGRIGGLKTLRGFNENEFFAQHCVVSALELRQYFDQQSYFALFYDNGIIHVPESDWQYLQGIGGGLSLNTSNGLFTFAAAIGFIQHQSNSPNGVKIHLGYTSIF